MSRNGWITVGLGIMPADRYVMTYDLASSSSMYGTYTYSTPGNDSQIPKQCLKKQVRKKKKKPMCNTFYGMVSLRTCRRLRATCI